MKICIFCGAGNSKDQDVLNYIEQVMSHFKTHDVTLIYGGAGIGIMGGLANTLMEQGGRAIGIIPRQLMKKEIAHAGLTDLHVVPDMHARKKMMYDMADAFLVFPGGMGTLDELFEILTWRQLGFHQKPVALMNINGYFNHLLKFLDHAVDQGLIQSKDRDLLYASNEWSEVWNHFKEHTP